MRANQSLCGCCISYLMDFRLQFIQNGKQNNFFLQNIYLNKQMPLRSKSMRTNVCARLQHNLLDLLENICCFGWHLGFLFLLPFFFSMFRQIILSKSLPFQKDGIYAK